jgi:hypothetical protein
MNIYYFSPHCPFWPGVPVYSSLPYLPKTSSLSLCPIQVSPTNAITFSFVFESKYGVIPPGFEFFRRKKN